MPAELIYACGGRTLRREAWLFPEPVPVSDRCLLRPAHLVKTGHSGTAENETRKNASYSLFVADVMALLERKVFRLRSLDLGRFRK